MATYHPSSDTESKAPTILAVAIVFLTLTYLSVGARCYVRTRIVRSFGWDDGLMVVALVFFTVWGVTIIVTTVVFGGGTRVQLMGSAHHWVMATETSYIMTAMMAKLSLGVFFLRLIIKPWQRAMVYAIMLLITTTSIFFFFFLIFHCGNPKDYLIRYIYDQCSPRNVQLSLTYLSAAIGAFADWVYALIPVQIVAQANMDLRSKLSVFFILSLGTAGCVCSTIRLRYVRGLISPTDFFWNAAMLALWSGIECGAAITAGSLATLRPLAKHWFARLARTWGFSSLLSFLSAARRRHRRRRRDRRRRSNNVIGSRRSSGRGVVVVAAADADAGDASADGDGNERGHVGGGSGSGGGDDSQKGSGSGSQSRSVMSKSWPVTSSSGMGSSSDGSRAGGDGASRSLATWRSSGYWEKLGSGGSRRNDGDEEEDDNDDDTRDLTALPTLRPRRSGSSASGSAVMEDVELDDLSPPDPAQERYPYGQGGDRQEQSWQDGNAAAALARQRLSTIDEGQRRESWPLRSPASPYDADLEAGRRFSTMDAGGRVVDAGDLWGDGVARPGAARLR